MGMLAIGNGEPCPFCGKYISEKADDVFKHVEEKHPHKLAKKLFGKKK